MNREEIYKFLKFINDLNKQFTMIALILFSIAACKTEKNIPPVITSIIPSWGSTQGGTQVTITGLNLQSISHVFIGGKECSGINASSTAVTCRTTANTEGIVGVNVVNKERQSASLTSAFSYVTPPVVTSVTPDSGMSSGTEVITITGDNFDPLATVKIAGATCTAPNVIDEYTITCTTPAGTAGFANIEVTNPNALTGTGTSLFLFKAPPAVTSLTPANGALAGGTTVSITGTGFYPGITATLDGLPCTDPTYVSSTKMTCVTPAHAAGLVNVEVTNTDTQNGSAAAYTYRPAPTVSSVSPIGGSLFGGNTVTITGTGFFTGVKASIGGRLCLGNYFINSTTMTCGAPANSAGTYDVAIINADSQTGSLAASYTYRSSPRVYTASPTSGALAGGTTLTLTGTGFVSGQTVSLGGSNCAVLTESSTEITCTTSAHATGIVNAVVTNPDTQYGTLISAYIYRPAPVVTSVSLNSGPLAGGNTVTINGSGFYTGSTVTIDGVPCTSQNVINAVSISCVVPAHAAGNVNVTVTNADSQTGTSPAYTYRPAPTVTSVTPDGGAFAGGNVVTINGTGFYSGITAKFDGTACTNPTYVSPTSMTCETPAHAAGTVSVVVTNADTQTGTGTNVFTYRPAPTITSISPDSGALAGGTSVTITGTNFIAGSTVMIGGATCTVTAESATSITCTTGAHVAGAVNVEVTNTDTQTAILATAYNYRPAPTITSITPTIGIMAGGTNVTITGTDFYAGAIASINGVPCTTTTFSSATSLVCATPAHADGTFDLTVTNADTQTDTLTNAYTYRPLPTVTGVTPNSGTISGGNLITITGTGFLNGATVTVGGVACTGVTVVDDLTITCTTGARAAGLVSITVTNSDTQSGTSGNIFTYASLSRLEWLTGVGSPTPPNPDDYGNTNINVTHTFTLKNTGDIATSADIAISFSGVSPASWSLGTDNCSGTTLAFNATCTVQVIFLGGGLPSGAYTAILNATASIGGSTTNNLMGTVP